MINKDTASAIGHDLGVELRETVRHDLAGSLRGVGADIGWNLREAVRHDLHGSLTGVGVQAAQALAPSLKTVGLEAAQELRAAVKNDLSGSLVGVGLGAAKELRETVRHDLRGSLAAVGLQAAQELRETVRHDLRGSLTGFGLDAAKEIRETIKHDVNPVIDHVLDQIAKPLWEGGLKGIVSAELVPVIDHASGKMAETINRVVDNALKKFEAIVLGKKAAPHSLASAASVGNKAAVDSAPAVVSIPGKVDDSLADRPDRFFENKAGPIERIVERAGIESVKTVIDYIAARLTEVADRGVTLRPTEALEAKVSANVGWTGEPLRADVAVKLLPVVTAEIKLFKVIPLLSIRVRS